jgi:FKBP-type peptidyl-prolyl cis-trans isomerase FkpA
MKPLLLATVVACLVLVSCDKQGGTSSGEFKDQLDSVSYAIGMNIGKTLMKDSFNINPDLVAAGARDAISGKTVFTDTVMQGVFTSFQTKMMAKMQERMAKQQDSLNKAGEVAKKKGEEFLAQNKTKQGVTTLPSGLQYEVVKEGTGATPKATDNVKVNYKGTLIDGTEFDSNTKHGTEPAQFNVSGVIPGWTEALKLMKVGSKWRLYVPNDLAYGMNPPPGGIITPGAVLIFDIELLDIVKGNPTATITPQGGGAPPQGAPQGGGAPPPQGGAGK